MNLIKANKVIIKRSKKWGIIAIFILPFAIIAILIANTYFRSARTSEPARKYKNQTIQPVDVLHDDSIRGAVVHLPTRKPVLSTIDSAHIQTKEKAAQTNQTLPGQTELVTELLIKFRTDDTCKLKIRNRSLGEVINWNLSRDDNGTLYLKPGKYSIVATNAISGSKTKTYYFDVKPGTAHTMHYLHIKF